MSVASPVDDRVVARLSQPFPRGLGGTVVAGLHNPFRARAIALATIARYHSFSAADMGPTGERVRTGDIGSPTGTSMRLPRKYGLAGDIDLSPTSSKFSGWPRAVTYGRGWGDASPVASVMIESLFVLTAEATVMPFPP